MMKMSKWGTAVVLGLILGLALFTTDVFAQGMSQRVEHGRASASVAVVAGVLRDHAPRHLSGVRGGCSNWGWGNRCRGFRGPLSFRGPGGFPGFGGPGGFHGCNGGHNCFQPRVTLRCISQRECRTVQTCRWTRWGRVCQGVKICRFRSVCRRCFQGGWNSWNG